jgi:hypothetical protein
MAIKYFFIFFLIRLGEAIDRTLLSHLLKMFTALGMYSESFEKPFLECTSEFYATEGVKYMQQSDIPDYLKHVEVRIVFLLVFMLFNVIYSDTTRHTI